MPHAHVDTAPDYADAIMVARRAKNWLFLLLLVMLLFQLAAFFVARYTQYGLPPAETYAVSTSTPTPAPAAVAAAADAPKPAAAPQPATAPSDSAMTSEWRTRVAQGVRYVTAVIDFLGIVSVVILAGVLLLSVLITLNGRRVGVAQVTSAFVWCVILAVLLFPWQAFLQDTDFSGDFKIPGILYTWAEYANPWSGARFAATGFDKATILHWARFVGWPVLAVCVLLIVQARSSRGLRAALGETELENPNDYAVS